MVHGDLASLDAVGQLEAVLSDIAALERRLQEVPLWRPADILLKQAAEARRLIAGMQARLSRRLVVTIVGPSGSGKSTLLNALAGVDELSTTGHERPTTRQPVALSKDIESVRQVLGPLVDQGLQVRTSPAAESLEHLVLVDTPDTDSTARDAHLAVLLRAIELSDVLICMFDAQNPKRRDHADFMAPLVRHFHGASLVAVLNKCDRLDAGELTGGILPDFESYLQSAWEFRPGEVLLVSARRHLQQPGWDSQAVPLHALDQFDRLRELVFAAFNQPGVGQDKRVANAGRIRDYLAAQALAAAQQDRQVLGIVTQDMRTAEEAALQAAMVTLRADDRRRILGVQVRFYQALAQRWLGPVGWLVAVWSRLTVFGGGLAALLRFGNPISQLWGAISTWRRYKQSRSALEALSDRTRVDTALAAFHKTMLLHWPDIAERLIKARFDPQVRNAPLAENERMAIELETLWSDRLDAEIERRASALSRFSMQFFFNLPTLALMGYVGWLTLAGFLRSDYLSGDFFLHALLTMVIVLLLSFFLLQVVIRLGAGGERIQREAFRHVERALAEQPLASAPELSEQIGRILELNT
jgi:energy-coupling factor transporter ATP-binding protein EcfA2